MKNIEYQDNIAEEGEVKIRDKNITSYVVALELCNKVMKTSENHTNIFNLKVYKNDIVALSELLTRTMALLTK
ncbi:hypothetical protein [Rickettsia tamurae]|uniref:hypothetical protein n=1 Tax=Rickettsia tamurae TaxID=334545 RepID=UPI00050A0954|nr:hypothetical protein [Rickettsia tamurae]